MECNARGDGSLVRDANLGAGEPATTVIKQANSGARSLKSHTGRLNARSLMKLAGFLGIMTTGIGCGIGWLYTHPPRKKPGETRLLDRLSLPYHSVTIRTADGIDLAAWYTPGKNGALILTGHGWGNTRLEEIHALFSRHGYGVLSWDFRAHGQSQGKVCTCGFLEALDVEAALDFAIGQDRFSWIGMWGGSMGGLAGLHAARRRPEIQAIVLEGVPSNIWDALFTRTRMSLITLIAQKTAERAANISMSELRPLLWMREFSPRPAYIIQGKDDTSASPDSGRQLFDAAGPNTSLWIEPGVQHMTMLADRPAEYERQVIAFFDDAHENCSDQAAVQEGRAGCRPINPGFCPPPQKTSCTEESIFLHKG